MTVVDVDGTTGLGGQWLTPPACTVLHQGQRTGSALAAGAGGRALLGTTGAVLTRGSVEFSTMAGWGGFDVTTETAGPDASGCADGLAD